LLIEGLHRNQIEVQVEGSRLHLEALIRAGLVDVLAGIVLMIAEELLYPNKNDDEPLYEELPQVVKHTYLVT
jgi:hypothetical protein